MKFKVLGWEHRAGDLVYKVGDIIETKKNLKKIWGDNRFIQIAEDAVDLVKEVSDEVKKVKKRKNSKETEVTEELQSNEKEVTEGSE